MAVPGKVVEISGEGMERFATVEVGSQVRLVSLIMLPEAELGEWILFHTGYALQVLPEDEAMRVLELIGEVQGLV
jgi:hydrogenase expression/formation protein HypC